MSFLSVLKGIGDVVRATAPLVSPLIGAFNPGAASIFTTIVGGITKAEDAFKDPGMGVQKFALVVEEFETSLQLTNDVLGLKGEMLEYDAAALKEMVDSQVAALNAMAKLKASMKVVPKS
jgi:hypothetical protein